MASRARQGATRTTNTRGAPSSQPSTKTNSTTKAPGSTQNAKPPASTLSGPIKTTRSGISNVAAPRNAPLQKTRVVGDKIGADERPVPLRGSTKQVKSVAVRKSEPISRSNYAAPKAQEGKVDKSMGMKASAVASGRNANSFKKSDVILANKRPVQVKPVVDRRAYDRRTKEGAQDDEELHSGSESVEIESEKDASLQEKTTSREPSIADEGYEFGEDVNGVASEGENASVYESDAESGVSQRDEDEDAGDDDEEDGEDEEGEEVQQPAESGSESGGEETSGRLRDFADPESRSAKEGAKANAYDKDMETNLGSSGFESLQEELYLPFAEKISKSLTAADSTRVSSTSAPLTKRAKDLMQIVKLNTLSYNIYDNPSINYEVFVKLFGKKTAKQAATQTVERGECETQTESITSQDKSVQHPFAAQGGQGPFEMSCATRCDPFKLSHFLLKAEKIVQLVSEEDGERRSANERSSAKSAKRIMKTPAGSEQFCAAFYKLVCSPLAKNMPISFLANDSQYLFSAQAMVKDGGEKSLVCLWPLEQTTNPEHLLIARSLVSCCGSASNGRVVAGMSDGSLALWELREPRHMHKEVLLGSASCTLRSPSFSTACATSANAMHQSAVIAVKTLSGNDEERGCQIASIDEEGLVVLWEIQETFQKDTSYMEEGMHPGGSVKLLKKTSIVALKAASKERHSVRCVGTPPNEVANIYLGTACGKVVRSARFSDNSMLPLEYGVEFCELISAVTCIDFNPVKCTSFLVGYDDGTLSLFSLQDSNPHIVWDAADTNLSELRSVQWVRNKPSVFVVLDSTSTIYLWDLESSQAPLFNFSLSKITLMTIFSDANHSAIVLGTEDGNLQVMRLNDRFGSAMRTFRLEKLLSLFSKNTSKT